MPSDDPFVPCAARRALLLGLGAVGITVLAGCGGKSATPPPAAARPGGADASPAQPTQAANPFDTGAGGGGDSGPPAGALAAVTDVPVGGGLIARDTVLIVQPKSGTFKAFEARCPHQGSTVDPPVGGAQTIMCPGHNSLFKTADGSLVRGPATRGLTGVPIKVQKGYIVQV